MLGRRSFVVSSAGLLACGGSPAQEGLAPKPEKERPVPEIYVVGLDGKSSSLADVVRGKVTLIDLWATWCAACRDTTARAVRLHGGLKDRGLLVVGVAEGEDIPTVSKHLETEGVPYPIYVDTPFALASSIGTTELPTLIIADRNGLIRKVTNQLDANIVRLLGVLLDEKP